MRTNTWLYISFFDDITDSLGEVVPYPQKHFVNRYDITYCWLLDGYFGTEKGTKYLNDIIARFILTFCNCKYEKHFYDGTATSIVPFKLKAFQNLKSSKVFNKEYLRAHVQFDSIFWTLKYYAEDLIRQDSCIIYSKLEDYAFANFIEQAKDKSTLKAKCRSIYYWYFEREWEIGRVNKKYNSKEQLMASRVEHMKKINKERQEITKKKVLNCITGMFNFEYKKKNGDWNISKIAKDSGTSRNTVYKYIVTI